MSNSFYSPSWYRVAELKPRLRSHAVLHRHDYRGRVWYILQDIAGGKSHRFTPGAYNFVGLMDGQRTVQQLWDEVSSEAGDDAPTQDEVIRLLGQLHATDNLITDVVPDSEELFRRYRKHDRMKLKQRLWTPLAVRLPMFDPERFLERSYPLVGWLFSRLGAALWLLVVVCGAVMAASHWTELTHDIVDRALTPQNLLVLWLVYPVVKALHELGHGYAVKHCGGEVHEIGVMLLVLVPVPYVDASSAWGVRDKYQRMLVGAAGIGVELFLGSLAIFIWVNAEPGAARAVAYNVMLISGVSTLLFNGNPLLKFDGYYVLSDAIEIPNLAQRSAQYIGYLFKRYLLCLRTAESPADSRGEAAWFFCYGLAAFIYRLFIMFAIILYIGGRFFAIGALLALWSVTTQVLVPMGKNLSFLINSPQLKRKRAGSISRAGVLTLCVLSLLFLLPAPFWSRAEGVIWPGERSHVRAGTEGFIDAVVLPSGSRVSQGDLLFRLRDPLLEARVKILRANQKELKSQLTYAQATDRVQAALVREELAKVTADLERASERYGELMVRSSRSGALVIPHEQDAVGRFARKGQLVAYVVEPSDLLTVRVVVPHDEVEIIHEETRGVDVRPTGWGAQSREAEVVREVPGGTNTLPSEALGSRAGGRILIDPRSNDGVTTLERVFEIDVRLPPDREPMLMGQRMDVRFDLGYMPLGFQAYRALRQLFLRRFSV